VKIAKVNVSVNCPVCYSGNDFDLALSRPATLLCDDCGFILSAAPDAVISGRCVFCGNEKFYRDAFLSLAFLGSSLICYVCEAKYKGFKSAAADEKFDPETARKLQISDAAINLKERIKRYHRPSNL
jgi:hypothetical protein